MLWILTRDWLGHIATVSNDDATSILQGYYEFWQGISLDTSRLWAMILLRKYCEGIVTLDCRLVGILNSYRKVKLRQRVTTTPERCRTFVNYLSTLYHSCDTYISSTVLEFSCNLLSLDDIMLMLVYDSVFRYNLHIFDTILPQISI